MQTITNDFRDVELWNLNPDSDLENRGPFVVVQTGIAPGDDRQEEKLFALRPDGKWLDLMHYFSMGEPEAFDEVVFETSQVAMELLDQLGPQALVEEAAIDDGKLQVWLDRYTGSNLQERLRNWLTQYRLRQQESDPSA